MQRHLCDEARGSPQTTKADAVHPAREPCEPFMAAGFIDGGFWQFGNGAAR
ncbi:hypothetical protein QFZ97_008818 [Paraburkholderia youngii]